MIKTIIKLPVLFVTYFMLLMGLIDYFSIGTHFNFQYQTPVAFAILCIGILIIEIGAETFRKFNTTIDPGNPELTTHLVTNGIYRLSRNPMYIGFLFWLFACALFIGNVTNFLLFPIYILLVNKFYISPEEKALNTLFDQEFEQYKNKVRRWI